MTRKKAVFAVTLALVLTGSSILAMGQVSMTNIDDGATNAECTPGDTWYDVGQVSITDDFETVEMGSAMCGGCGYNDCISSPDTPPAGNT